MKTVAVRLYGADDLRVEEFELPNINDNEISLYLYCRRAMPGGSAGILCFYS